jgi:phosphohistidine swiveling domain-containing protein/protein-tyrosine-phosphatase
MKRFLHKAQTVVFLDGDDVRRAPMVAAVFESLVKRDPILRLWDMGVCSAGTGEFTTEGAPPHRLAVQAMHGIGLDIGSHKASVLSLAMLKEASLVVAMEQKHIDFVAKRFSTAYPGYCTRMVVLLIYLGADFEIASLIGAKDASDYAEFAKWLTLTYCLRLGEMIKYETLRPLLLRGTGLGTGAIQGKVKVVHATTEDPALQPGDILVCHSGREIQLCAAAQMRSAGGIITDSAIQTHQPLQTSNEMMTIPCISSTETATHLLNDGQMVTMDATTGLVYGEVDAWYVDG